MILLLSIFSRSPCLADYNLIFLSKLSQVHRTSPSSKPTMKLISIFILAATASPVAAIPERAITPLAERENGYVSLSDGPTKTGRDSQSRPNITNPTPKATTSVTITTAAIIQCEFAADPNGAMGLCPNLSNEGWCDCGTAGTYQPLPGDDVCGYTTIPSTGSVALTSIGCVSTTVVQNVTQNVAPTPLTIF
jgi:hypothetical protein